MQQRFEALENFPGEQEHRTKCYIDAQLFLENRAVLPEGKGFVEKSICDKHAQYGIKLMDENKKFHSIFFHGHVSSLMEQGD